ncbi:hypothetical protein GQ607_017641 [Colletotrichum asianum]|uniref:Uncharacterized protein n=1 Tax=Colletotrichum asianum TaxID=702518 RepID=A0A8H3VVY8_9PEZI|nr:hypothetical protein GQ607_017641 [Colletotrichum asianum]
MTKQRVARRTPKPDVRAQDKTNGWRPVDGVRTGQQVTKIWLLHRFHLPCPSLTTAYLRSTHAVRVCRRGVSAQRPYVTPPGSDGMIDAPIAEMESPTS